MPSPPSPQSYLPPAQTTYHSCMRKAIGFIGTTIGGYAGWWLGARGGTMTGFIVSVIGSGIGLYFALRWSAENLP
jgi:uncharacterized membrane protein YeaQ/YmgE (transglycosylase-associated protein family)